RVHAASAGGAEALLISRHRGRCDGALHAQHDEPKEMYALAPEQRDTLREEFPDRLTPGGLRERCLEKHPEWSKRAKSGASSPRLSVRNAAPSPKRLPPRTSDDEAETALSAADRLVRPSRLRRARVSAREVP